MGINARNHYCDITLGLVTKGAGYFWHREYSVEKPPSKENGYKDKLAAQHCARQTPRVVQQ
jgi:hypothetical protein